MKNFATIAGTSGAYPNTVATDVSAPGAADGTPVIAQWVNELMGAFQAILNEAGLTPSGTTESSSASQILSALRLMCKYPGEIFIWGGPQTDLFSSLGIHALPLSGQGIVRANYSNLDTAVYCGDANNPTAPAFFRSNTATSPYSRNITGTYLILPNFNGQFLRAIDPTGTVDVDGGSSRLSGDIQADAVETHTHTNFKAYLPGTGFIEMRGHMENYLIGGGSNVMYLKSPGSYNITMYGQTGSTSANETRPTNVGVRFFIAY